LYEKKPYRPKTLGGIAAALAMPPEEAQTRYKTEGLLAEHVVAPNENLSRIARFYYGDGGLADVIAEANRDLIDDPDDIYVGWRLRIPKLAPAPDAEDPPGGEIPAPDGDGQSAPA